MCMISYYNKLKYNNCEIIYIFTSFHIDPITSIYKIQTNKNKAKILMCRWVTSSQSAAALNNEQACDFFLYLSDIHIENRLNLD